MNHLFSKLSVLGLILTTTLSANAANKTPTVEKSRFSINLTGYYLQPGANNLTYAVYTRPLPVPAPNWDQITLNPGHSPAFNLGLQYALADTNNVVKADWFYLNTSDSSSFATSVANTSIAPPYYFGPLAQALTGTYADSNVKFIVSQLGLVLGHLFQVGNQLHLEPFAGINGAYLKQSITSTYVGSDSSSRPYSITSFNTSKFTGIGPRMGVSAAYFITDRFSINMQVGGSLFAGTMQSTTNFNSFGAANTTPAYTTLADQSVTRIVPEVESKLEVNYKMLAQESGSRLSVSLGYLFASYLNGINQVVPTALVPGAFNNGVIAIETSAQEQNDLSLNGPYLRVDWGM